MRYAVISDIHSNKQALEAVLKDIDTFGADKIVCLGDIIGYGPSPLEVLDLLRARASYFVLGNHDAVAAGYINSDNFNMSSSDIIEWTCRQLDSEALKFLQDMPLLLVGNNIRFSHGEFENPGRFGYIDDEPSAAATFAICPESLMMVGHSHVPGIFVIGNSGVPHWVKPQNFGFEENKRYIVNVGSVGQPRDDDNRASYCIVDDAVNDVLFRKVEFDLLEYKNDLAKNSLPPISGFLFIDNSFPVAGGKKRGAKSSEKADFKPLSKDAMVKIKRKVQNLEQKVSKLQRSRKKLIYLVIILTLALVALPAFFLPKTSSSSSPTESYTVFSATDLKLPVGIERKVRGCSELLSMPKPGVKVTETTPLKQWNIMVSDPDEQEVSTIEVTDTTKKQIPAFYVRSKKLHPVIISSFAVPAEKGTRFVATAQFKPDNIERGHVEIRLKEKFADGTEKILLSREPKNLIGVTKWLPTSITIPTKEPIARDGTIFMEIFCNIKGAVKIRKCSLKRKE